jgi:hypothetical protein
MYNGLLAFNEEQFTFTLQEQWDWKGQESHMEDFLHH